MSPLLEAATTLAVLFLLLLVGLVVGYAFGRLLLPRERRRQEHRLARMRAEAQIDALTRQTLQAMRDAAYSANRRR